MLDQAIWLLAAGVVCFVCAVVLLRGRLKCRYRRGRFLSANEKKFLGALDRVVGSGHRVFVQVRLADLVDIESCGSARKDFKARRQVFGKSVDFVICNRSTLDPIMIIEVDDASHERVERRRRDVLVDRVCAEAGLPLLRVKARFAYSEIELMGALRSKGLFVSDA
ncbi:Protein of unknown function [Rhodoblastus acidophilus]|uniref:DUF2726 domain-containing protein n=1 Tax=Rhodoblastus acidophilus TaxID=1074 RepID=A0A212SG22_RHOAC|nr:DUF2726 domain-containing protein [Rhodoblastus acidophilus]PPQ34806.1 DUF2726 domain-containing protein [Rhodoblastus acidophilus]RAI16510.1 DUF2726 domain-containing protein [Rhodoblastus acidophilus]SNB84682.1 Protein of unknown function [Rhodoblastus acidophilus]